MAWFVVRAKTIFHRSFSQKPLRIVSASGTTLTLDDGRTIIDATGGPGVACIGHNVPEVAEAVTKQLKRIGYLFSGGGFCEDTTEELASHILEGRPGGLSKAIFLGSGSEATEAMLKLVTQFWAAKGEKRRVNFVARKQSYHGNTLGALCITGHEGRRDIYRHWMSENVSFVDACCSYRGKLDDESDEAYLTRLVDQIEAEFQLLCGMGRTGTLHAWQQEDIRGPDLQMIGKSLGGGFIPVSGVLVHQRIFEAIATPQGALAGGHTFQAHPTSCAAALAVQRIIKEQDLLSNVRKQGELLGRLLQEELGQHPLTGDIRGRGLLWAVEFMRDPATRTPFPMGDDFSHRVVDEAVENQGVLVLKNLGFPGTWKMDSVVVSPPFIITEEETRESVKRLRRAVDVVAKGYLDADGKLIHLN
ncbi:pyridoxal phosphate-dependent transferase [Phyllosticta citrichinensis]|uniref:Pyridoxal phosphate-dependent transferase n=1 Tax=Phyllosticta citrichinensis TaxID=1130410 RepID=A0ABR1XG87_9PEZI